VKAEMAGRGTYLVWLLMAVAAVAAVFFCGGETPYWDDWSLVPVLSGQEPLSIAWLTAAHNEHRFPVSRLFLWTAWRATGDGCRLVMLADVLLLAWAVRLLMLTTARLRRGPDWADVLLPVLLLHWGHMENLLWSFQLAVVSATVLFFVAAAMLAEDPRAWRPHHLALACGSVLLLPLHTGVGVAMTPGCAAALAVAAVELIRCPDRRLRRHGAIAMGAVAVACLVVAASVAGYRPVAEQVPVAREFGPTLRAVLQCAGMGLGVLGRIPILTGLAVLGFSIFSTGWAFVAWRRRPEERALVLRLGLLLLAAWTVAAVIGWGRVRFGAMTERYALMSAPILVPAWMLSAVGRFPPKSRAWCVTILLAAAAVWAANMTYRWHYAMQRREASRAMRRDIADGLPLTEIAGRNWFHWASSETVFRRGLSTLLKSGIVPFRDIVHDPPYDVRTVPYGAASAAGHWHGVALSLDRQTRYDQPLAKPTHVLAVRTRWIVPEGAKWIDFAVEWSLGPRAAAGGKTACTLYGYALRTHEIVQTTWIDATIDTVSVRLDAESTQPFLSLRKALGLSVAGPHDPFTLAGIDLLVPR
jgi:hypothetical protein